MSLWLPDTALAIQPVENLTAVVDEHTPSIILKWDRPSNAGGVTAYDVRYQPSNSWWMTPYHRITVKAPATNVRIARKPGLHSPAEYDFEVRARDADCEGQWTRVSKFTALALEPVQNLMVAVNTHNLSVTLNWNPPVNGGDVTAYDISYRAFNGWWNHTTTVKAPNTSVVLTREDYIYPFSTYDIMVRARQTDFEGQWSKIYAYTALIPGKVQNLRGSQSADRSTVTLNWEKPSNAKRAEEVTAYEVSCGLLSKMITVNAPTTSVDLTGIHSVARHHFRVRARNADYAGEWTTPSEWIALAIQPVENLRLVVDKHEPSMILKWDRPSSGGDVTAYDVRYKPSNGWWITPYHRMTVKAPATSVLLARKSGLHLPAIYNFEVRARDASCEGQWSKISEYNALALEPVQNLVVAVDTHNLSMTLIWNPPVNGGDVTAYDISYRASNGWWNHTTTVKAPNTSVVLTREDYIYPFSTYDIMVRAREIDCEGQWSKISAYTALIPGKVQNLRGTRSADKCTVTLNWDKPDNAKLPEEVTSYDISCKPLQLFELGSYTVVNAPTTSARVTDLRFYATYEFSVRARNAHYAGEWTTLSEYIGILAVYTIQ